MSKSPYFANLPFLREVPEGGRVTPYSRLLTPYRQSTSFVHSENDNNNQYFQLTVESFR
jgi:hypothetical protein